MPPFRKWLFNTVTRVVSRATRRKTKHSLLWGGLSSVGAWKKLPDNPMHKIRPRIAYSCDGLTDPPNATKVPLLMSNDRSFMVHLFYVLVSAAGVYVFSHWSALTNPYVVNEDVRQQIYWMQEWNEPGIFDDDLLTRYAKNYVPWGVQFVYGLGSFAMNPVQFTKVLTGILFISIAGLLLVLARGLGDDLTALYTVCFYFLMAFFISRISGGLSRGFGLLLLIAYLIFMARDRLLEAGMMLLLQSLFNPYIFVLCFVTHVLFVAHAHGRRLIGRLAELARASSMRDRQALGTEQPTRRASEPRGLTPAEIRRMALTVLPVLGGVALMGAKYVRLKSDEFGDLVTRADIVNKIEYTALGRFELLPPSGLLLDFIRPLAYDAPLEVWPGTGPWFWVFLAVFLVILVFTLGKHTVNMAGFRVFAYLLGAAGILYAASSVLLMRLFLPSRYIEYPLAVFYCLLLAVSLRVITKKLISRRVAFPVVTSLTVALGAILLYDQSVMDYSGNAMLLRYLRSTPRTSLIAGHPQVMDNIPTFAARKAFITYELSHTWYKKYWEVIKKRTYDFFQAYYSEDPEAIRRFCRQNGIDYLLVRESDFSPEALREGRIYFEPFGSYIREVVRSKSRFAVLDERTFPPLLNCNGIRVLKPVPEPGFSDQKDVIANPFAR